MAVVISGIGLVSPLGATRESSWQRLLDGKIPPPSAEQGGFTFLPEWLSGQENQTQLEQLALQAAQEAFDDAGLQLTEPAPRFGCVVGTSKGPLGLFQRTETPFGFDQLWPSGPLSRLLQTYPLQGPALCPVSACATGLDAILRGARLIEQGDCDAVLAGSVDASLNDFVRHSYRRLGVLAHRAEPLATACRPFDEARSGFVIGEGGALFVLQRAEDVETGKTYATFRNGINGSDATGLTQVDRSGVRLSRLLGQLLIRSSLRTSEIDLLHLHGTGTRDNDLAEARAVRDVFGPEAQQPWSTASKGAHGHALGAAGSLELAWLLLSLRDQIVPPVINLKRQDRDCPVRLADQQPLGVTANLGMKISLGFGGHQTVCLFERGDRSAIAASAAGR